MQNTRNKRTGWIAVEGMHFDVPIGYYPEEKAAPPHFTVDVYLMTDISMAAADDELGGTIDYQGVFWAVKYVMGKPADLLEGVCARIISELQQRFGGIIQLRVRVTKHHPALGGQVERVSIELSDDYQATCPETRAAFVCYKSESCWCHDYLLSPETLDWLRRQYKQQCLSPKALRSYGTLRTVPETDE